MLIINNLTSDSGYFGGLFLDFQSIDWRQRKVAKNNVHTINNGTLIGINFFFQFLIKVLDFQIWNLGK